MANDGFQVGDIVKLKSGGPDMTVRVVNTHKDRYTEETVESGTYRCQWFAGKKLDEGTFPRESLITATTQEG